jgi:isoamylase
VIDELAVRTTKTLTAGTHYPLGTTLTGTGVNFALYSEHASAVFLLLFAAPDQEPTDVIELQNPTKHVWHAHVGGVRAGQLYGYKVCGDYQPVQGKRFNSAKLLLDPYAKAVTGKFRNTDNLLLAYDPQAGAADLIADSRDTTRLVPKAIVVDDNAFDWQQDASPDLALEQLIIYEVHVKGFTAHESSGVRYPGTYLGFTEKIPYLTQLGVNAVEFLPVHEFYIEDRLLQLHLTNYWGYQSIGFFAPESSYSTGQSPGCQVTEFKTLVRELHRAGIKVLLDVVYNHTGEGDHQGPTIAFRGIDNPSYYCLTGPAAEPLRYYDHDETGVGNALNFDRPAVIRLVMDSLRYWVEHMHVDGFRFDLASVLGRSGVGRSFQSSASFFDAVSQDPVLNRVIMVAEPWDASSEGGYQVGNFPIDWSEWNGKFRDNVRRFGKGDAGQVPELGYRMTGSSDLYGDDGRSAYNSINFVTCHDGFTLHDLVAYNGKHNEANGENNQDGFPANNSWNCGVEGDTADPQIVALRKQIAKNHFCHVLFASGTPMLLGGDEFLRTQRGNNNAYCQDNPISWFDWTLTERSRDMVTFVGKAIALTRRYPVLQRRKFYFGEDLDDDRVLDVTWFGADGNRLVDWSDPELRTLCYQLDTDDNAPNSEATRLFFILHADYRPKWINLPPLDAGQGWYRIIDTSLPSGEDFAEPSREVRIDPADHYIVNPRSTVALVARR